MPTPTPAYRTPLARRPRHVPFGLWLVLSVRGVYGMGGVVLIAVGLLFSAGLGAPWNAVDAVSVGAFVLGIAAVGTRVVHALGFVDLLRVGRSAEAMPVGDTLEEVRDYRPGSPLEKMGVIPSWMYDDYHRYHESSVEVVEFRFVFEDHRGQRWPVSAHTTEVHRLSDEVTEQVLYDPDAPRRAVLLDALPRFVVPTPRGWASPPLGESIGALLLLAVPPACLVLGYWLVANDVFR